MDRAWLRALVAATLLAGCMQPLAQECLGGGVCPPGQRCTTVDDAPRCVPSLCGDGHVDPGEWCDDGNNLSGDGCPADCGPACGDGHLDPGEACDDGNNLGGDGCPPDCRAPGVTGFCGDGTVDPGELCDDGNEQSHDGCSSRCRVERAAWATQEDWPDARVDAAMAYDAARGRAVMFGGAIAAGLASDTWEWDGAIWHRGAPGIEPPPRADHAMAYDPVRRITVMFGGGGETEHSTWEWNGFEWSEVIPHPTPAPQLRGVAMAFVPSLHGTVLFGGRLGNEDQDQTWLWDGASWQRLVVSASPPPRAWAAAAYDVGRKTLVLFGGVAGGSPLHDTWEFDGATWTERTPPLAPPARGHAGMAFDAAHGRIALIGGAGEAGLLGDAWSWDGTRWDPIDAAAGPAARRGVATVYDAARDRVVAFGGDELPVASAGLSGELWEFDGGWRERTVRAQQPPPRARPGLIYDPLRGKLILFGGHTDAGPDLSDLWTWDGKAWAAQPAAPQPVPRGGFALAADGAHPVLFGGLRTTGQAHVALNDTWVLADLQWIPQATAVAPLARSDHAMAFDAARGRLVLFGGVLGDGTPGADTWEWDGSRWLARPSLHVPPARAGHALAYDRGRGRVVLFGGSTDAGSARDDTWEWDGTDWTERTPAIRPAARVHGAMVGDAAHGGVVLFGGDAGGALADTWTWDGTSWAQQAPVASPPARSGHAMAFDATRQRVVMVGGAGDAAPLDDVWEWDGASWQQAPAATGLPPAREATAMVYDPARTTTVMFGGAGADGAPLGDTWVWDGAGWRAAAQASPPPRSQHAIAFDTARGRAVLFAGAGAAGDLGDVWEWDGASWLDVTPAAGPPARHGQALVYDAARETTLLIGGITGTAPRERLDAWTWDGTSWTDVTPQHAPPWRTDFAAAFDDGRGVIVVFGGRTSSALLGDLWEWDGSEWTDRTADADAWPSARFGHAMTYDPARHRIVMIGGQDNGGSPSDVWEWDGTSWVDTGADAAIAARRGHAMVYDTAREAVLVFGGRDASGVRRTTGFLRYDDPGLSAEVCETGIDGDGDGKVGCGDPDCQGLCGECGNGVCEPFESCHLCPKDCGECHGN